MVESLWVSLAGSGPAHLLIFCGGLVLLVFTQEVGSYSSPRALSTPVMLPVAAGSASQ